MLKNKYLMLLCLIILLTNCSRSSTAIDTIIETPLATSTPEPNFVTPSSTLVVTKTATALKQTSTLSATLTSTPTPATSPSGQPKVQCPEILTALPLDANAGGFLVLTDEAAYGGWGQTGTYFLDLMTGNRITLSKIEASNHQGSFFVSPDRVWLAYSEDKRYVISATDGLPRWVIPQEDTWLAIYGWQDNENIWIEKRYNKDDPPYKHSRILLNIHTLEQQEFPISQYPNIYYMEGGFLLYDPTLTLAVYTKSTGTEHGLAIWNMLAEREEAFFKQMTFFYEPAWSSDGQYLAAGLLHSAETSTPEVQIHGNEIYQVDRDGRETRLTYLTNNYSKSEIGRLAWSPDNRYIAFELNVEPISYPEYAEIDSRGPRLAVLDTQTYQVTNYCIPLGVNGSKLIWSPDSRQIIVQNLNVSNRKMYTLWIDNETGVAAQIAEDMVPVGWMVAP